MSFFKIFQKIGTLGSCNNTKVDNITIIKKETCLNTKVFNDTQNSNYNFTKGIQENIFYANIGQIDNHGYQTIIPTYDTLLYYDQMENLINIKWVDYETIYVMAKIFYYNTNLNALYSLQINFERQGIYFSPSIDYELISKDNIITNITFVTLFFAVLTFITSFVLIKRDIHSKIEKAKELDKKYEKIVEKLSKNSHYENLNNCDRCIQQYYKFLYWIQYNFKLPGFLNIISKIENIIFIKHILLTILYNFYKILIQLLLTIF